MSTDPATDYEGGSCGLQPYWDNPDEEGNLIAVTSEEWAELMAEVAEEQSRLEAEVAAEASEREQIQADFWAEQEAMHALCRYLELREEYNGPPLIVREKSKGGLMVKANQPMLTGFFAEENLILWEPQGKCFFTYQPPGIWKKVADERVVRDLLRLLSRLCRFEDLPEENSADICTETLTGKLLKLLRGAVMMEGVFDERWPVVPVKNAVLQIGDADSKELVVTKHHPSYYNRYALPVSFDAAARCPQFDAFLKWALPDPEDRRLMRAIAGQWLLGTNLTQTFLIMEGTGNSGKSTLVSILTLLIGDDNWGPLRTKLLNDRFELGHLMDKTLLIANEVGADFLGSTSATTLKALVGGDRMGGEIKFGGMSTKVAQYNAVIVTNERLNVPVKTKADMTAWRRRLVILPFLASEPEHPEPGLADRLFREEGAGILNWALGGIADLRSGPGGHARLPMAEKHYAEVEQFLGESNSLEAFVRECLLRQEGGSLSNDDIKRAYRAYCEAHGWNEIRGLDNRLKPTVETVWEVGQRRDDARGQTGRWYPDLALKGGIQ